MALNIAAMRKHRQKRETQATGGGGEWFNPESGETLLYIAGTCRPEDDLNYVEVVVHYKVGPNNNMVVSLDPSVNAILGDKRIQGLLDEKGIETGDCPINKEYMRRKAQGDDDGARAIGRSTKFLFNVIPVAHRNKASDEWRDLPEQALRPYMCGSTVWEGILDLFFTEGDITDPSKAVLVRLVKSGKGLQTRYKISADSDTLREPLDLGEEVHEMLDAALQEGGQGDLYRMVANMVRPAEEVEALLSGIQLDNSSEEDEAPAAKPSIRARGGRKSPAKKAAPAPEESDDGDDELDALERELSKRSRARK